MQRFLILENIRSAYNVGAMFRTADAAQVTKILLCGYTPTPTDRFGRQQAEIHKTSLGASETMSWQHYKTTEQAIQEVRAAGAAVVAVELSDTAVRLGEFTVPTSVAYILGNEVHGVSAATTTACDVTVYIPMYGKKESLNVATAAGIVLYYGIL